MHDGPCEGDDTELRVVTMQPSDEWSLEDTEQDRRRGGDDALEQDVRPSGTMGGGIVTGAVTTNNEEDGQEMGPSVGGGNTGRRTVHIGDLDDSCLLT